MGSLDASTILTVTTAANPVFTAPPTDTNVSAAINPSGGIHVQLLDNLGGPLSGQSVTMAIGTNPPGTGTLSGTLVRTTDASGTAAFIHLKIDWLGQGYTLVASAHPVSGAVSSESAAFNELRAGDACLGPNPACYSGCHDSDNDGLNDAWESAGGIDLNGDGIITDSTHDVLLPGADANKPDVYVKYDYMVTATHSHQPSQAALDQVIAAFAAHGVNLHFAAPNAGIAETVVTTLDPDPSSACAGSSVSTMKSLRAAYFGNRQPAYHYMVFAHRVTTPDLAHQPACPSDPTTGIKPDPGATGSADIAGDDAIISFGSYVDAGQPIGIETMASTIMHELGHNFSLLHGGPDSVNFKPHYISVLNYAYQLNGIPVADAPGSTNFRTCAVEPECGPPVISTGECATPNACHCTDDQAAVLGTEFCYRVDYSGLALPSLNELSPSPGVGGLDETVGISGPSTDEDLVFYFVPGPAQLVGVSNGGAIDWNNDGVIGTHVSADINSDGTKTFLTTQIDTAPKIIAAAGAIEAMLEDGLIVTSDVEMVRLVRSQPVTEAADVPGTAC